MFALHRGRAAGHVTLRHVQFQDVKLSHFHRVLLASQLVFDPLGFLRKLKAIFEEKQEGKQEEPDVEMLGEDESLPGTTEADGAPAGAWEGPSPHARNSFQSEVVEDRQRDSAGLSRLDWEEVTATFMEFIALQTRAGGNEQCGMLASQMHMHCMPRPRTCIACHGLAATHLPARGKQAPREGAGGTNKRDRKGAKASPLTPAIAESLHAEWMEMLQERRSALSTQDLKVFLEDLDIVNSPKVRMIMHLVHRATCEGRKILVFVGALLQLPPCAVKLSCVWQCAAVAAAMWQCMRVSGTALPAATVRQCLRSSVLLLVYVRCSTQHRANANNGRETAANNGCKTPARVNALCTTL
jgi:hypothetical protein